MVTESTSAEQSQSEDVSHQEEQWQQLIDKITQQSQVLYNEYLSKKNPFADTFQHMTQIGQDFQQVAMAYVSDPMKFVEAQSKYIGDMWQLWADNAQGLIDPDSAPVPERKPKDKRFSHEAWNQHNVFEFLKDGYLLFSEHMMSSIHDVEHIDDKAADRVRFYTRQFVNALAPSNFSMTNPVVLSETIESQGLNLVKGLSQMLDDFEKGKGKLSITMTDVNAFEPGVNVASTPGSVVFENRLLQLIQYQPTTEKVYKRPLLIVPPCINKYYILDLREKNSLVKWLTDQGHTVFIVSWFNPDASCQDITFEDYILQGTLAAINGVKQATGEKTLNVAGYCIGGTLLAMTLAYMKKINDKSVAKATYFATLLNFEEPGDVGVFIDEEQIEGMEKMAAAKGYFSGNDMAMSFNLLRENDLFWSYYINNYLLGKDPIPFDLLYWNSDATNLPPKMHSYYLRNMYLDNQLIEPDKLIINGQSINIKEIDTPAYFLSTEQDHIALWQSTYEGAKLHSGEVQFVLGGSGHIAGVINAADSPKYGYRTANSLKDTAEDWLEYSTEHPGSWWRHWHQWLVGASKKQVNARVPGTGELAVIEAAPGRYMRKRA